MGASGQVNLSDEKDEGTREIPKNWLKLTDEEKTNWLVENLDEDVNKSEYIKIRQSLINIVGILSESMDSKKFSIIKSDLMLRLDVMTELDVTVMAKHMVGKQKYYERHYPDSDQVLYGEEPTSKPSSNISLSLGHISNIIKKNKKNIKKLKGELEDIYRAYALILPIESVYHYSDPKRINEIDYSDYSCMVDFVLSQEKYSLMKLCKLLQIFELSPENKLKITDLKDLTTWINTPQINYDNDDYLQLQLPENLKPYEDELFDFFYSHKEGDAYHSLLQGQILAGHPERAIAFVTDCQEKKTGYHPIKFVKEALQPRIISDLVIDICNEIAKAGTLSSETKIKLKKNLEIISELLTKADYRFNTSKDIFAIIEHINTVISMDSTIKKNLLINNTTKSLLLALLKSADPELFNPNKENSEFYTLQAEFHNNSNKQLNNNEIGILLQGIRVEENQDGGLTADENQENSLTAEYFYSNKLGQDTIEPKKQSQYVQNIKVALLNHLNYLNNSSSTLPNTRTENAKKLVGNLLSKLRFGVDAMRNIFDEEKIKALSTPRNKFSEDISYSFTPTREEILCNTIKENLENLVLIRNKALQPNEEKKSKNTMSP